MDEEELRDYRKKMITEIISSAAFLVTIALMSYMTDETSRQLIKARIKRVIEPIKKIDLIDTEVQHFRRQISDWEHEEMGR